MENKMNCVFGCYLTDYGKEIKDEMISWLNKDYNVICVDGIPGECCSEYYYIKKAIETSVNNKKPVLYVHTKGAAHKIAPVTLKPNIYDFKPEMAEKEDYQKCIRYMWKDIFSYDNIRKFNDILYSDKEIVICPYTGKGKITWQNGFIMNYNAAKKLQETFIETDDRYYYERMFQGTDINVIGIVYDDIDNGDTKYKMWKHIWSYFNKK